MDDIIFEDTRENKKKNNKVIIIFIGIFLIIMIILLFKYLNSYSYYEKKIVRKATKYINNNGIVINKETYFSVKDLDINVKDNCSNLSGVLINENYEYQAYLKCNDYETNIFDNDGDISLKGDNIMIIPIGVNYYEYGIYGKDNYEIYGSVGTAQGVYNLNYVVDNTVLKRKVIIYNDDELKNEYPSINLNGSAVIYLQKYDTFNDPKVSVYDQNDININNKVKIEGNVNTNEIGEYDLIYSVTNEKGYTNSVKRKVIVAKDYTTTTFVSNINPYNMTNENVTITLYIEGLDYSHTLLPNNNIDNNKVIEYEVSENGEYIFKIYDTDDTFVEEKVVITNINKEKPTGSCKATLYRDKTVVNVNATSPVGINSYNYKIDNFESGYINSNIYNSALVGKKNISVIIKDNTNNIQEILCTIENNSYREIYVNSDGKQCLSGYTCFIQDRYSKDVQYCTRNPETSDEPCGSIVKHGCGVISTTTIFSRYVKSPNGDVYDPYEMVEILKSVCSSSCGFNAFGRAADKLGIPHGKTISVVDNKSKLLEYLKNDYPAIIRVGKGSAYTSGGHFMMLLGMNQKGEIFLADTHGPTTIANNNSNFKVNSWITIDELINGGKNSAGGFEFMIFGTNK